jgi:hypothetical protein
VIAEKHEGMCQGLPSCGDRPLPSVFVIRMGLNGSKQSTLLYGDSFMKPTDRVLKKRLWLTLGFVAMLTIISAGQVLAAALTPAEEESLLYMREEEKLARDVYIALYDKWGLTVFNNIAVSEQTHMDAVKTLLNRYKLKDPVQGPGVFTNQDLQETYNKLIIQGNLSVVEALNVGVIIEQTDIQDLKEGLAIVIHKDIKRVYENLMVGSENHLAAFQTELTKY